MTVMGIITYVTDIVTSHWPLFLFGAGAVFSLVMAIRDRRQRSRPNARGETWPQVEDCAARVLNPYKLACWLDRRKPEWPLPSQESNEHYDDIVSALTDDSRFGNELPLGRQSPPWAHPWAAQVYWEQAMTENGEPNNTHEIQLTRSLVRRYLRSITRPLPEFLDEKYDDRFPWK